MSEPDNGVKPIRIKLRRIYDNQQSEIVEKNLQNLEARSFRKKYAQEKYYSRNILNVLNDDVNNKIPVHARLGMRRINLRRGAYRFLNNGFINKRFPLRRKLLRGQGIPATLQNRLRLRRSGPRLHPHNSRDYTIQIRNNMAMSDNYNMRHSCIAQLNTELQGIIRGIQAEANNTSQEVIPSIPLHVPGYGTTSMSLHNRFSM